MAAIEAESGRRYLSTNLPYRGNGNRRAPFCFVQHLDQPPTRDQKSVRKENP
jgi:hypothetical protein